MMTTTTTWNDERQTFKIKETETHYIEVMPLMVTFAIVITAKGDNIHWCDDRWCYNSVEDAAQAALRWDGNWPLTEPDGWHRHPFSGRRRPDGDPAQEYVRP